MFVAWSGLLSWVQITDVGRSLYIGSFCPAMILSRCLEEAAFSISISSSVLIFFFLWLFSIQYVILSLHFTANLCALVFRIYSIQNSRQDYLLMIQATLNRGLLVVQEPLIGVFPVHVARRQHWNVGNLLNTASKPLTVIYKY